MNLIDRIGKKTKEKEKSVEAELNSEQMSGRKTEDNKKLNKDNAPNGEHRFFFVTEEIMVREGTPGIYVVGNIHGKIKVDDVAYITTLQGTTTLTVINGLEVLQNGKKEARKEASDQMVTIYLKDIAKEEDIDRFSVISSIRPQAKVDGNREIENPVIAGLLYEVKRLSEDETFFNLLLYRIAHGYFLTPVKLSQQPTDNGDGTASFSAGMQIGFQFLNSMNDEKSNLFPVFTDWNELRKWEALFANGKKVETIVLRFPDCVTITERYNSTGFVINPFGENQCLISQNLIQMVTNSSGYQSEFGQNA